MIEFGPPEDVYAAWTTRFDTWFAQAERVNENEARELINSPPVQRSG